MELLLVPILILAYLLYDERRKREAAEGEWRAERSELLTRIQAPQMAPTLTAPEPSETPLYIPFDDQDAYDEYVRDRAAGLVK